MRKWFFQKTFFGLLLSSFFMSSITGAATVAKRTEPEMVKHATAIVRAKVLSVNPRWHSDNIIVTDVVMQSLHTMKWDESFKKRDSVFKLVLLGGTIGGKTLKVAGTSHYEPGEEVVVFMERGGNDLVEMGVGTGKYSVQRQGAAATISKSSSGVATAVVSGKAARLSSSKQQFVAEPLSEFEQRILGYIQASQGVK